MERAGRGVDLADGNAAIVAVVRLPLKNGIDPDELEYFVAGDLTSVTSEKIVPYRMLATQNVAIDATRERIRIDGPATLDGVALELAWEQPLGVQAARGSRVSGTVELGPNTISAFGLPLPKSLISGRGFGEFSLALKPELPPHLSLTSDLVGLGIIINGLGWTKARGSAGEFALEASLGSVPNVSKLSVTAPGLTLTGHLDLNEDGSLQVAKFDSLKVGRWLDAKVKLTPRGKGRSPAVTIERRHIGFACNAAGSR